MVTFSSLGNRISYCNTKNMTGKKILFAFFRLHQSQVWRVLALDFLANLATLLLPLVIVQTYSVLFDFQSVRGRLLEKFGISWKASFFNWLIILILLILIKALFDFLRKRAQGILIENFLHWLRQKLFVHHLRMEVRQYEERGVGRYLLRFSGDLGSVQQFLSKGIVQFSADVLLVGMGLGLLFWLDAWLGGLVLVTLLLLAGAVFLINRRIGTLENQRRDQKSALLSFINLRLLHIASLKAYNKETPEMNLFNKRAGKIQKLGVLYHHWAALLEALVPFAIYALLAVAFFCIYYWKQTGYDFSFDKIVAFVLILLTLRSTLSRTLRIPLVWKKGNIALRKITELLLQATETGGSKPDLHLKKVTLHFEQVSLAFEQHPLFENLSFSLSPGKIGVITGKPGTGKSTIVKLLAGLYQPTTGKIRLNEHFITHLHPKSLRRPLAFVSDALPLYGRTIGEALAYSARHRAQALQLFRAWQSLFPALEPLDFETPMREAGRLSGTQLQLLQWLRAILTKKPFLILDEPFQNLDTETVQKLWQQIPTDSAVLLFTSQKNIPEFIDNQVNWKLDLINFQSSKKINAPVV